MFEAHFTYAELPLTNNALDNSCIKSNTSAICWHNLHQCNVRYWVTLGKRQSQTLLFIYIEFKKTDNSHDYKRLELIPSDRVATASTDLSVEKVSLKNIQKLISITPLGKNLDRIKTQQWCQFS